MCIPHKGKRYGLERINKALLHISILFVICCSLLPFGFVSANDREVGGKDIVSFAKEYLGCSYRHGATGPESFDCSGFVYFVFDHFGVELSTSSSSYYYSPEEYGEIVDEDDAKKGDIISWSGHVGIYLGKGKVLHALNSRTGVCITDVSIFRNSRGVSNPPHHFIRVDVNAALLAERAKSTPAKDAARAERSARFTGEIKPLPEIDHEARAVRREAVLEIIADKADSSVRPEAFSSARDKRVS